MFSWRPTTPARTMLKFSGCRDSQGLLGVACRYTRVGSVVMLLHDPSDIFLEGAKLADYAGAEGAAAALFAGLVVSWAVLRLGLLPFWVIRSCLCAPWLHVHAIAYPNKFFQPYNNERKKS